MSEILNTQIFQIHLLIVSIMIPIIIAWVRSKISCLDKVDKRTFRISQALITMAEDIDKQTNRAHKDAQSTLAERLKRGLEDERGNL